MAVVQISKIQVRRGQKNSISGIPQLSSAEFAWAIDSQELFIGNGSVAEGAPFVGNTKILTEHDNILELASSYQFASNDTSIVNSVPRSLQSKLDEYVSVLDFGAVPDGSTDCTLAFEQAFEDLFENASESYKKVLYVPNGFYKFDRDLTIPSTARIAGETPAQAVLDINDNNIFFATPGSSDSPVFVKVSNLTVISSGGQVDLSTLQSSTFDTVSFVGEYQLGDTVAALDSRPGLVTWTNQTVGNAVTDVKFINCEFQSAPLAVKCEQTARFDTRVDFDRCKFTFCETAIFVDGFANQGTLWRITDCDFEVIYRHALISYLGTGTRVSRSRFVNCGNEMGSAQFPVYPIIYFTVPQQNTVLDCSFDRHQASATSTNDSLSTSSTIVAEVHGASKVTIVDQNSDVFGPFESFQVLTGFDAIVFNSCVQVDYTARFDNLYSRQGTLIITIDQTSGVAALTDSYQYSSVDPTAPGGPIVTNFEFGVAFASVASSNDTLFLSYRYLTQNGVNGTINYSVSYGI
jgi:hypothetical protein